MKKNSQTDNSQMDDIFKIVSFLKDNAVSKHEFNELKSDVTRIKALMVTKDYLDEKLADLRGDLVVLTRKEDTKVKALINLLKNKKIITPGDAKQLFTLEPFAELMS